MMHEALDKPILETGDFEGGKSELVSGERNRRPNHET